MAEGGRVRWGIVALLTCAVPAWPLAGTLRGQGSPSAARGTLRPADRAVTRAVGRAPRQPGVGEDSLRQLALQAAMADAVDQAAALASGPGARRPVSAASGVPSQWFRTVVRSTPHARVTRHEIISEGLRQATGPQGAEAYEVVLRAWVREEPVPVAPAFPLRLVLNATRFADRGSPEASDEIIATITAGTGAYLTVFGITDEAVDLLFPNSVIDEVHAEEGVAVEVPSELLRNRAGLRLRATLPPGSPRRDEVLVVVATRAPIPFAGEPTVDGDDPAAVPTVRVTPAALSRWLRAIRGFVAEPPQPRRLWVRTVV